MYESSTHFEWVKIKWWNLFHQFLASGFFFELINTEHACWHEYIGNRMHKRRYSLVSLSHCLFYSHLLDSYALLAAKEKRIEKCSRTKKCKQNTHYQHIASIAIAFTTVHSPCDVCVQHINGRTMHAIISRNSRLNCTNKQTNFIFVDSMCRV